MARFKKGDYIKGKLKKNIGKITAISGDDYIIKTVQRNANPHDLSPNIRPYNIECVDLNCELATTYINQMKLKKRLKVKK